MPHTALSASSYPCPSWCVRAAGHDLDPMRDGCVRRWHISAAVTVPHADDLGRVERAELECFETVDRAGVRDRGPVCVRTDDGAWPLAALLVGAPRPAVSA